MHLQRAVLIGLMGTLPCFGNFSDTRTIEHGLMDEPRILVNPQGYGQTDLSIRGGSYTGTGLSLNGLNLKVPYSAHFNSELPLLNTLLSAPRVQTGLENRSGHLVGTAAYTTIPRTKEAQASVALGTEEHYRATLYSSTPNIGGFIDWNRAGDVDYDANDFERFSGGAFVQLIENDWTIDFLSAGQSKEFGAQGYYGIPSNTYAEERIDDDLIFASASTGDLDGSFFRMAGSYRELNNEYLIPSASFFSETLSRHGSIAVDGRTLEIQHIALNLRGDIEHERVSGDIGEYDRTRGSFTFLPEARFERIAFKAGINSVVQSDESAEFLPLAGIDWSATDNSTIYASYTETERQPDFETLYYTGPFRSGNPSLNQQHARNVELGLKQFLSASLDWRMAGFARRLENASDWIAGNATDLGHIDVHGIESGVGFYPSETLEIKASYQWLHKDNETENGLYETDYPEHMLNLFARWAFLEEFAVDFSQTMRYQTDNSTRTGSDFGAFATLGLHYLPRFANNARLSLRADNLWGTNFQSIPGLKPQPATVSAEIAVNW